LEGTLEVHVAEIGVIETQANVEPQSAAQLNNPLIATASTADTLNQNMAVFDRAWLPDLAREQMIDWKLDWKLDQKLANDPAIWQRESAPANFPQSIDAEMVWTGAEFQGTPDRYRIELQEQHVRELEDAAAEVEGKSLNLPA
jgi:hypothetical protein